MSKDTNFDVEKWKKYREKIDRRLWFFIDKDGHYTSKKKGNPNLYPYIGKVSFNWGEDAQLPKEIHHRSRFKTITIDYELAETSTPDHILEMFSQDEPLFEDIKIIAYHSGYTRNPLGSSKKKNVVIKSNPEEDTKE